ncbi:unnamed protein product [Lathyrus oleraceus]
MCIGVRGYGKQYKCVDWKCLGLKPKPYTVKHGPHCEKRFMKLSARVGYSSSSLSILLAFALPFRMLAEQHR